MKIKVDFSNEKDIERALRRVSGAAEAHTYTSYNEVARIADWAEDELYGLGLPKNMRAGAGVWARSGDKLPNSYKHQRIVTNVRLLRGRSDWYLVDCYAGSTYNDAGRTTLYLTKEQDERAISKLKKRYIVKEES